MLGLGNDLYGLGGMAPAVAVLAEEDPDFVEPGVPSLFAMLIKPIRDADQRDGGKLLQRFLKRPSELFEARLNSIRALATIDDPATVRADLLKYLKNTVGFTSDFDYLTGNLDENSLRRLIALAVPLWNKRGTAEGLAEWVRLLTGRSVDFTDWFSYRWLLDENASGIDGSDWWIIGGEVSPMDEYVSHLRVMDRGTLDRALLLNLVRLGRLMSERIEVAVVDFLDSFDEGRGLWTTITGTPGVVSSSRFMLPASGVEEASVVITDSTGTIVDPSTYGDHTSQHVFRIGAAGDAHVTSWGNRLGSLGLQLAIKPWVAGAQELALTKTDGTPIATATVGSSLQILPTVDYTLRIDSDYDGASAQVRVYIDEVLALDRLVGAMHPTGTFRLSAPGTNTGINQVDKVQLFRHPLRFAEVAPGGTTTSSNFFQR